MTGGSGPATVEQAHVPAAEPPTPAPRWYRRRPVLVGAGVVVVVAAAVLSDLPTHTSRASDIQAETTVAGEIAGDVAPCVFAVREALTLYADETSGSLSAGNRAQIPGLLRDDQDACSLTDASIFALSDIEVPGTPAGKDMGQVVNTATIWATSDALAAIEDIQALTSNPSDHKARAGLVAARGLLAEDSAKVAAEIGAADQALHTTLPGIGLTTKSVTGTSP